MRCWDDHDFESMNWHDMQCYGFKLSKFNEEYGSCDFEIFGDYILQWICEENGKCKFVVAPVIVQFHGISGLVVNIDYKSPTAGMCQFSLNGIEREGQGGSYQYSLFVNWPIGKILFMGGTFSQRQVGESVETYSQGIAR